MGVYCSEPFWPVETSTITKRCGGALHRKPKVPDCSEQCTHPIKSGVSLTAKCGHLYHLHCGHEITTCKFPVCQNDAFGESRREVFFDGNYDQDSFQNALKVKEARIDQNTAALQEEYETLCRKDRRSCTKQEQKKRQLEVARAKYEEDLAHFKEADKKNSELDEELTQLLKANVMYKYVDLLAKQDENQAARYLCNQIAVSDNPQEIYLQLRGLQEYFRDKVKHMSREKVDIQRDPELDTMARRAKMLEAKIATLRERIEWKRRDDPKLLIDRN